RTPGSTPGRYPRHSRAGRTYGTALRFPPLRRRFRRSPLRLTAWSGLTSNSSFDGSKSILSPAADGRKYRKRGHANLHPDSAGAIDVGPSLEDFTRYDNWGGPLRQSRKTAF